MAESLRIIENSDTIDRLLAPYHERIGADFEGYRNHLLRVLTYTLHFLDGDETDRFTLETALVFHDIGLWTDNELAYLEPSIAEALRVNKTEGLGVDPELLTLLIHWHHKVFPYKGPHERLVNAFRRGDWVDATGGKIRKGLSKNQIAEAMDRIPEAGFAATLERLAADLSGGNKMKGMGRVLSRVYKW